LLFKILGKCIALHIVNVIYSDMNLMQLSL
jgi:hypothetical protein